MKGFISLREAAGMIHDGMTVMVGGFLGCGNPHLIIDELLKTDVKEETGISDHRSAGLCFCFAPIRKKCRGSRRRRYSANSFEVR